MERVTQAEAARQLDLNKSTLSRWCKKHPALLDDDGLVSVEELREHRKTVVNPKLQTRKAAAKKAPEPSTSEVALAGLNADRGRRERARADEAELDLAERLGLTLRRDDVENALAAAAEVLRQTSAQLVKDMAEKIAAIDDPRTVEVELAEMMRKLQARTALALSDAATEDKHDAA